MQNNLEGLRERHQNNKQTKKKKKQNNVTDFYILFNILFVSSSICEFTSAREMERKMRKTGWLVWHNQF